MQTQEKFYEDSGVRMRYLVMGQGTNLLFLHGVGVSTQSYLHGLEILAQNYQVIAPDLPGFGRSSIPKSVWSYDDYSAFLNKFSIKLGLSNFMVVGHSFGGEIALRMSAVNPNIQKLVLIGATGAPITHSVFKLIYIMLWSKSNHNLRLYKNPRQWAIVRQDYVSNIFRKILRVLTLAKIIIKSIYTSWPATARITVPALILWSSLDEVLEYKSIEQLCVHLDKPTIVNLDEGHDWLLYKPQVLMDKLAKWDVI